MYRPLPPSLTISPSQLHGLGIHATEYIPANESLGITHVYHGAAVFQHGFIRTPLGGYLNHSDDPNCLLTHDVVISGGNDNMSVTAVKKLKTLKGIEAGSELTVRYSLYDIGASTRRE